MTSSCSLDRYPLSQGSADTWYSNADEMLNCLNDSYRKAFYTVDVEFWTDRRTDDWSQRDQVYDFSNGSVNASTSTYQTVWENSYKAISRSIRVLEAIDKIGGGSAYEAIAAEADFFIGFFYAHLANLYGDVPYYEKTITIEEATAMTRTNRDTVMNHALKYLDKAIEGLPESNTAGGVTRVNKNVARAIKARYCLYWKDYQTCRSLCEDIINSGRYSLYYSSSDPKNSYGEFFTQKGYNTENIFIIGQSYSYEVTQSIKSWVLRTAGGTAVASPSWDLLAAYECTDGKNIVESALFDNHDPFKNRDPRMAMTFVVPGSSVYGMQFQPAIDSLTVYDSKQGKIVDNQDNKIASNPYASYNSCIMRKGAQDEWRELQVNENPEIIIRYADVLLMKAECDIELNEIGKSTFEMINRVRARAYGIADYNADGYPKVTTTDQKQLRIILRRERRVEMALEGRRWYDLRRWGLLKQCYSVDMYAHPTATDLAKNVKAGEWFWDKKPTLLTTGDFANIDCEFWDLTQLHNAKLYGKHQYDPKVELFPIPEEEVKCNPKLGQNPGY